MNQSKIRQKNVIREIALERIYRLFDLAIQNKRDKVYAKELISLAKKISERNNVSIPHDLKFFYCRKCSALLFPAKQRVKDGVIILVCDSCGFKRKIKLINTVNENEE